MRNYAVAIIIDSPEGIPFVRDSRKPHPCYWKFPGGRSGPEEEAKDAILREVSEETGLSLREEDIVELHREERESHTFVLFGVSIPSLEGINKRGNEGEEVKVFQLEKMANMNDFFPNHKEILFKMNIIKGR